MAGSAEPFAVATAAGQDAADESNPSETSLGERPGPSHAARQQHGRAVDQSGRPEPDPDHLVPARRTHSQPARKRLRKRGPSPPVPGTAAADDAADLAPPPSLDHGRQAGSSSPVHAPSRGRPAKPTLEVAGTVANPQPLPGSSSPVGGLPRGKPAEPTLEVAGTVAEPKPCENQQQPAPARRRRLTKRRSSAAEGTAAADKAAGEPAAVREQPHVSRATPEPWGTGDDADIRTAGCEAAGGDADNRTAGREAAGGDADNKTSGREAAGGDVDDKTAGCEAAGDEAASGDADMRASPEAAEGASMGTGGAKLQQGSAKRGSASLRPAAADAEDRGQAGAGVLDPQQPAKRKRLTQRADPADVAAVEAGQTVGAASRPEQASIAIAQQPGSTAGAGTGAAAEEGGVAVERTYLVSKHAGWTEDKLPAWLTKRRTKVKLTGSKEAEGWWRQCCSLQATPAALVSWRGMRDAQAVAGAVCRGHTLSKASF